jgi:hypothetical protein
MNWNVARILLISAGFCFGQTGAPPGLLFRMSLENTTRHALAQEIFTNPDLEVQAYGDGKNMLVAVGKADTDPHLFDGLCEKPCGFTLRDKNHDFDLTGRAKIKWTTIVSGFHRARPLIKLPDGTLLIGDQADGSMTDWQQSEVSLADVRWLKLDPVRGVTVSRTWEKVDLSRVSEVGFFDVIPGSGTPPGGWVAIASFELWGKPVARATH